MSKKILIATGAILLLVVVTALLPALRPAPVTAAANGCLNNLRQIDGATSQWALDQQKTTNDIPTWEEVLPYMTAPGRRPAKPICDHGGTYTLGRLNTPPRCSYPGHSIQQP